MITSIVSAGNMRLDDLNDLANKIGYQLAAKILPGAGIPVRRR